jgi:hypothetical protein
MRRALGILLIAIGMFAITLGLLLGPVVYDRLAKAPLDPNATTDSEGTNMTVFYPKSLIDKTVPAQRTDVTLTAKRVVRGKLDAPEVKVGGDVAMWRVGLVVEDERKNLVSAVEHWVCVDRKSGEGVAPCAQQKVDDGRRLDTSFNAAGQNYRFPFNTERKDYTYFDTTLRMSTPMRFEAEDTINGLPVYRFVQRIDPTKVVDQDVPGQLVGAAEGTSVKASLMYENTRTVWVEPYSGTIVKGEEKVRQVLRGPDGKDGTVVIAGTLAFTPQTIQRQVDSAKESSDKLRLLTDTGPLVAYIVGGIALIVGVILVLLSRAKGTAHRRGERRLPRQPVPLVKSGTN